ncbi:MAG: hypothetical protein LBP22_06840 [Deltaproteobacteria bacterium]|nr:hypothetical protein [Deltaproteobacteria bacterium]
MGWSISFDPLKTADSPAENLTVLYVQKSSLILYARPYSLSLDNKTASKIQNPYFSLLSSLELLNMPWGILTDGGQWCLVASKGPPGRKNFLAFNLEKILSAGDSQAFFLFWSLFRAAVHVKENQKSLLSFLADSDRNSLNQAEKELTDLIDGSTGSCLLEEIGQALFRSEPEKGEDSLGTVLELSLYFIFRLIFLAHFEDRHLAVLSDLLGRPLNTLRGILCHLKTSPEAYKGWDSLLSLLSAPATPEDRAAKPLQATGFFEPRKTPQLFRPGQINDHDLSRILKTLLNRPGGGIRDFSDFSPARLGAVYENLLQFQFRVAKSPLVYAVNVRAAPNSDRYFNLADLEKLKSRNQFARIKILRQYRPGDLYLKRVLNDRKTSGTYYTPEILARPLSARGIDRQLAGGFLNKSLTELRILDCSCGSGNLLIEALDNLTEKALNRLDRDPGLKKALEAEIQTIRNSLLKAGVPEANINIDEFSALKRLLLKRTIFGVDLSSWAVELTRTALWLETYIEAAELPFIEHRVKEGNSLMGTTAAALGEFADKAGLIPGPGTYSEILKNIKKDLRELNDSHPPESEGYKEAYLRLVRPLDLINKVHLNLLNYSHVLELSQKSEAARVLEILKSCLRNTGPDSDGTVLNRADDFRRRLGFFNWDLEFPEVFLSQDFSDPGFHILIGNPPWEKTKFEEPLFFAQYQPNYRTLSNAQKRELGRLLLADGHILSKYNENKALFALKNDYLKARYPLNSGSGDGNLFRFFVERGLELLAAGGSLNYIVPTGLLTEDNSAALRRHVLENYRLNCFDGFENRRLIFPAVDGRYKFGLIQIEKTFDPRQTARTRFMINDPEVLETTDGVFDYSLGDVRATSPKFWAYLEVAGGEKDLKILRRLYESFPPLSSDWLDFTNELHATQDKSIFRETKTPGCYPLYKGEMIRHYQAQAAPPKYWLRPEEFDNYLLKKEVAKLKRDLRLQFALETDFRPAAFRSIDWPLVSSLLDIPDESLADFICPGHSFIRLGLRSIARDTNERTLVASLLPRQVGVQNSMLVSVPGRYVFNSAKKTVGYEAVSLKRLLLAQALYNSLPVDWLLRASVNMNVSKTYLIRIPLPQPSDGEISHNSLYRAMIRDSALLTLYNTPALFPELKSLVGPDESASLTSYEQFLECKAAVDVKVGRLYGLEPEILLYFLDSFQVLKAKQPEFVEVLKKTVQAGAGR